MPQYRIAETVLDVARNAMLVDTNVLIAAFYPQDEAGRRDNAQYVLEDYNRPLLVPMVVVVEALGFIVGSRKDHPAGLALLGWLNSPGRATIVPQHTANLQGTHRLMESYSIDCVDAMLAELASDITLQCLLNPSIPIVTFDTSDFGRMSKKHGLRLSLVDMRTLEEYEIG